MKGAHARADGGLMKELKSSLELSYGKNKQT
jgi:hypothetical protein